MPLITLLRGLWGLRPEVAPATIQAAIEARLLALGTSLSERLPYVLRLLEVPGEADLLDTVSALVERLPPYPVLLLLTYRPGYRAPWGDKSYTTQESLSALSAQDSRHLVRGQLSEQSVPESLIDTLIARGSGNPLFLEELADAVCGQDMAHAAASVPETVQTVMLSRLDRLSPARKQLLQVASVVGSEVSEALLQAVTEADNSALADQLPQLQADELMFASRRDGDTLYHFKHKLVQEAVYHSLLQHSRRQYHARIEQCLVDAFPDALPEQIAHHYTSTAAHPMGVFPSSRADTLYYHEIRFPVIIPRGK